MNKKLLKSAIIMAAMVLFVPAMATAQVTIGGGEPPRATLDVRKMTGNTNLPQGIIPPQLTFIELEALEGNYISIAGRPGEELNGAIVFVNCVAGRNPAIGYHPTMTLVTAPGLYLFDYGTGGVTRRWRPLVPSAAAAVPPAMIITNSASAAAVINPLLAQYDKIYVSLYGGTNNIAISNGQRRGQTITVFNAAGNANFELRILSQTANTGTPGTRTIHPGRGAQFIWMPGQAGCPGHWMFVY